MVYMKLCVDLLELMLNSLELMHDLPEFDAGPLGADVGSHETHVGLHRSNAELGGVSKVYRSR